MANACVRLGSAARCSSASLGAHAPGGTRSVRRVRPSAGVAGRIVVDALLVTVFALHHSACSRASRVEGALARLVPAPLLRSVYVWVASAAAHPGVRCCGSRSAASVYRVGRLAGAGVLSRSSSSYGVVADRAVGRARSIRSSWPASEPRDGATRQLQTGGRLRAGAPSAVFRMGARGVRRRAHDRRPAGLRRAMTTTLSGDRDAVGRAVAGAAASATTIVRYAARREVADRSRSSY